MAEEVVRTEEVEERPRDTVVVDRGSRSNAGLIILAIVIILLLIFFLSGNPFSGGNGTDIDVDVPAPTVNTPAQ